MASGNAWLTGQRTGAAVEQILQAAEDLFGERGPTGVGMAEIAEAAGCSRATLYRYFESRRALQTAFAHREALRIVTQIRGSLDGRGAADVPGRAVDATLMALEEVRARRTLREWIRPENMPELLAVLSDSPVIEAVTSAFLAGPGAPADPDRVRWFLRCMVSLLGMPAADPGEERRLVERFVAPALLDG